MAAVSIGFADVVSWRAAPLGEAGDGLKKDVTVLEASRDTLEAQAIPESWTGLARILAEGRRKALVARIEGHITGKTTMQKALYAAEALVTGIERAVQDVEEQARSRQFSIGADGSVTDTSTSPTFDNRFEAEEWSTSRQSGAQAIADEITAILERAAAADAVLANGIPAGRVDHVDHYGVASPEVAEQWASMTDDERRAVIAEMIEEQAAEAGIDTPEIVYEDESWGLWGQARDGGETIAINEGIVDDPFVLNTVAHEMRHARQFEAIDDQDAWHWPWDDPFGMHEQDGISEDQAEEWDENFDDYKSTDEGDTYEEYFDQPVEVDARNAGKQVLEGMTEDELERLLEEGR
jgi:hypothetical protein